MENAMFVTSVLVNIATIISILLVIRREKQKEMQEHEERHQKLIQKISEQKEKEFQREHNLLSKIQELESSYDNELGIIKMNIQQIENQRAIETEKLRASVEKLMLSIEALNDRVNEIVKRVSEIEKFFKVLYEFIGYTKGEKNARRKSNQ